MKTLGTVQVTSRRDEDPFDAAFSGTPLFPLANVPSSPLGKPGAVKQEVSSRDFLVFEVRPLEVRLLTHRRGEVSTRSTDSLNNLIALGMSEVPTVERVYSKYRGKVFYTWIVIEDRDTQVLREIYAREAEIIKRFPDFGFDFYVIYRSGADIESLVSGDIELVFNRR